MFGFAVLGFVSVPVMVQAADVFQVTSTATFIPPSPTPTQSNFVCPVGTPAGWGTYTPSALWMVECSSCGSVGTPTGTATLTPTATLAPLTATAQYLTGTPTATITPTSSGPGGGFIVSPGSAPFLNVSGSGMTIVSNTLSCVNYPPYVHCRSNGGTISGIKKRGRSGTYKRGRGWGK